jgi:hypothetical protein
MHTNKSNQDHQLCRGFAPVGTFRLSFPNKSSAVLFPTQDGPGAGAGASSGSGARSKKFDMRAPSVSGVYCTKSEYVRTARRRLELRLLFFTFRMKIYEKKCNTKRLEWKFKWVVSGESCLELRLRVLC